LQFPRELANWLAIIHIGGLNDQTSSSRSSTGAGFFLYGSRCGVWGLSFGNAASTGSYNPASGDGEPGAELYFASDPGGGAAGLFGYLAPASTDLTEGNDQ
jgi:hypothetical protein